MHFGLTAATAYQGLPEKDAKDVIYQSTVNRQYEHGSVQL